MEENQDGATSMMRVRSSTVSTSSDVAHEFPEMQDRQLDIYQSEGTRTLSTTVLPLPSDQDDNVNYGLYMIQASPLKHRSRRSSSSILDNDSLKTIKQRRDSGLRSMFFQGSLSSSTRNRLLDNGVGREYQSRPTMSRRSISAPSYHGLEIDYINNETVDNRHRTNSLDSAHDFQDEVFHLKNSLRMGADKRVTFYTEALLHDSIQHDDLDELCDLLHKHEDMDLDKSNSFGITPLHRAAIDGGYRCMNLLLSRNVNVKVRDIYGWTPLHDAIYHGHIRCAAALITAGSNVEAETNDFTKPIEMAQDDKMLLLIGRAMTSPGYVYDPDRETLV